MTKPPDVVPGKIRDLDRERCLSLLSTTTVGRVGFSNSEGQQLVPVNFTVIDETIYLRTLPGGFLSQLGEGQHDVAFGVDHHEDTFQIGWNVTVKGVASRVKDRHVITQVMGQSRLRPWSGGARSLVLKIEIVSIAGRHVRGH